MDSKAKEGMRLLAVAVMTLGGPALAFAWIATMYGWLIRREQMIRAVRSVPVQWARLT